MSRRTNPGARRWRAAALLAIGIAIGTTMVATPAGAHLTTSLSHLFKHADARYVNVGEERTTALFQEHAGALPLSQTFRSSGRPLVITASGSGYTGSAGSQVGMTVSIDGFSRGEVKGFSNEASSHKAFVTNGLVVTGLARGTHTLSLDALGGTSTDPNDFFTVTIRELASALALGADGREPDNDRASFASFCTFGASTVHSYATLVPSGDVDWHSVNCYTGGHRHTYSVVGGAKFDVFPYFDAGAPAIVTNRTTWTGDANFYKIRVHGPANTAYTLRLVQAPVTTSAARAQNHSIQP